MDGGEEDGHVRPRAWVHCVVEQETVEYVEEEFGLKEAAVEHPEQPEQGSQTASLLVSRTMNMSCGGVPSLALTT